VPRQPEGKLVAKIKQQIKAANGKPFKIQASEDSHQEVGIPDLLCCVAGRFVGIEVKQPGEQLRPAQRVRLREIYDAGGFAAVVETVGQVAVLLLILEKESDFEKSRSACFDRGHLYRDRCHFS
jgi:hypothetical protein